MSSNIFLPPFVEQKLGEDTEKNTTNDQKTIDKDSNARTTEEFKPSSSRVSLEQRNENEIIEHPNEVTQNAQIGVRKAEATALVWSKTAVRAIYAW
jgi:hypothetical protein